MLPPDRDYYSQGERIYDDDDDIDDEDEDDGDDIDMMMKWLAIVSSLYHSYLSIHPSIDPTIHLFIYPTIDRSIHLSI